jgi:hypothetical protein
MTSPRAGPALNPQLLSFAYFFAVAARELIQTLVVDGG